MFSTSNQFQLFKAGSGRRGTLQIQTGEPIKSIRIASNFIERPWSEIAEATR